MWSCSIVFLLFFFNDPATTEIYTLSLHDALPIFPGMASSSRDSRAPVAFMASSEVPGADRKSTRLNSSHRCISYAVFCLKKKKNNKYNEKKCSATLGETTER